MRPAMAEVKFKYLIKDVDRYKTARYYVRIKGKKIRLLAELGSAEWHAEYERAKAELLTGAAETSPADAPPVKGTFKWLGHEYMASAEFKRLDLKSQRNRASVLDGCFAESIKPGSKILVGSCPIGSIAPSHLRMLRDRKAAQPGAANNRLKYLSSMFAWAIEAEHLERNPARDVKRVKYASDGFHAWTETEIKKFEDFWPIGTKQRTAITLLLYTGARRCDAAVLGPRHFKKAGVEGGLGSIVFVPAKTKYCKASPLEIPVLPALAAEIAACPPEQETFIVTEYGKPFSVAGFGAWFIEQCGKAGLPHCGAHGLRKAGATILAERGATDRQLMSVYGWSTAAQATTYTKKASQKKLAQDGMRLMTGTDGANSS